MAELVGGAILSAIIKMLVERLGSPEVLNFFQNNQFVSKLLEKLDITLWSANALLNDAENKQVNDENVKNWVDKLNEVLNEADRVLDEINTEALRRKIEGKVFLKKLVPITLLDSFGKKTKPKVEEVVARLELLLDQKDRLGLKEGVQSKRLRRSPSPLIGDPSDVYGRDGDKEAIVQLLFSENVGDDKISVIPIVGMGGVGKTTLARLIYSDIRVKNHFEHKAWVTVSDDFDVFKLAKLVFEEFSGRTSDFKELGRLRDELENFLSGKKFLLVLDDVWNESYSPWNALKSFFRVGGDGSKIIATTRSDGVASIMGGLRSQYSLKTMSFEDCWQMFKRHAFRSVEPSAYRDVEKVGREIVEKCKGLPLAVMSLAGLLCSVSDEKEWKEILKSDVWELREKGNDEILPSLWLSYSYLPPRLKCCFAYCSIFPKDYEFRKERMVSLWMAEGLLRGSENMEDVGEEYFKILTSRSLFQRSAEDDDQSKFVVHDLVHDLATFVSGRDCSIKLNEDDDDGSLRRLTNKTRHLLYGRKLSGEKQFQGSAKARGLRTLLPLSPTGYCNVVPYLLVKKFKFLRVLCLSNSSIRELPKSIGKLKHLRHLDLSKTHIARLPDTVCSLYNLQTLLLHECVCLTQLPARMGSLVNLRHLDVSDTCQLRKMPLRNWSLKGLRTLTKLVLNDESSGSKIKELRELSQYHSNGSFEIVGLKNVVNARDVYDAEFDKKRLVTKLKLDWSYSRESNNSSSEKHRRILDALRPHENLKKLDIMRYGGTTFSNWVADQSFSNTTEMTLWSCKRCRQLPPFGQLPSLKKLEIFRLRSVKMISLEFYGSSGTVPFPSLESIMICELDKLRSWSFEHRAFPRLKGLHLIRCPMLINSPLPHCLPSLELLTIRECYRMEALLPIGREMNDAFPLLETMDISDCPELKLSGFPLPSSLNNLYVYSSNMIYSQRMEWGLVALKKMHVQRCGDSFPEEGLLPSTLLELGIDDSPDLKSLNGKSLRQLTSLMELRISKCPKLQCLPEEGLPDSVYRLAVDECPLLKHRLKKGTGEDWHKISHIRDVF